MDLTTFDPLLFGSVLTEGEEDFLDRIRPAVAAPSLPPKAPSIDAYSDKGFDGPPGNTFNAPSAGEHDWLDPPTDASPLAAFLDDLYSGLGCHAEAFEKAGITSEHMVRLPIYAVWLS